MGTIGASHFPACSATWLTPTGYYWSLPRPSCEATSPSAPSWPSAKRTPRLDRAMPTPPNGWRWPWPTPEHWDEAETVIQAAEPAADPARSRAEWLADRAEREIAAGRPDEARKLLRQALGTDYPADWRARAAGRLLTLEPAGGGEAAVGEFLAALGQPADFADAWVLGPDGVPARLRDLAARHFGAPVPSPLPIPRPLRKPAGEFDLGHLHRLGPGAEVARDGLPVGPLCAAVAVRRRGGAAGTRPGGGERSALARHRRRAGAGLPPRRSHAGVGVRLAGRDDRHSCRRARRRGAGGRAARRG